MLEHKYASVIGRLVKLWMAYKKEKRSVALCCRVLQCVAVYCRVLQFWFMIERLVKLWMAYKKKKQSVALCCSALLCVHHVDVL